MDMPLWTNYARDVLCDLTFKDAVGTVSPFPVPGGTTVEAVLKDTQNNALTPKKTVVEATPGSDWANGRVVVQFTAADLAPITVSQGIVELNVGGQPAGTQRLEIRPGIVPTL